MWALVIEWSLSLAALGCLAGAVLAFVYVPAIGRYVAAGLVAVAAGLASYNAGYVSRGRLDLTQALQAQLDFAEQELAATKTVTEAANSRAHESEQQAATMQEQIRAYEAALAAKPEAPAAPGCPKVQPCSLDSDDVRVLERLRVGPGAANASHAPGRAR